MTSSIALAGPHRQRALRYLGAQRYAGWRLKLYGIAVRSQRPRLELVEAAKTLAARELPAPAVGDGASPRYGVGFVVVHDAADYGFVLLDWWAGEHEVHQKLFSCPLDRVDELAPHESPAIGCVWELAVVDFERRAWLRHVLDNPAGPDLEAYFHDHAHDDV